MRFLLLSRPVINAGDFLFTEKSLEAIKRICPEVEVTTGHMANQYTEEYVNSFDAIIAAGGPLFDNRFLSADAFPILRYVKNMRPHLHFLSNGWYGRDAFTENVFKYRFNDTVLESLKYVEDVGGVFHVGMI